MADEPTKTFQAGDEIGCDDVETSSIHSENQSVGSGDGGSQHAIEDALDFAEANALPRHSSPPRPRPHSPNDRTRGKSKTHSKSSYWTRRLPSASSSSKPQMEKPLEDESRDGTLYQERRQKVINSAKRLKRFKTFDSEVDKIGIHLSKSKNAPRQKPIRATLWYKTEETRKKAEQKERKREREERRNKTKPEDRSKVIKEMEYIRPEATGATDYWALRQLEAFILEVLRVEILSGA